MSAVDEVTTLSFILGLLWGCALVLALVRGWLGWRIAGVMLFFIALVLVSTWPGYLILHHAGVCGSYWCTP